MPNPLCLVTGASAGLGVAFAENFARRGHDLVLTARRGDRLEGLAARLRADHGVAAHVIVQDLAKPDAVPALMGRLAEASLSPDVLVNNAGYGLPGRFLAQSWEAQRDVLRVLLERPAELVHALAPAMVGRGRGWIVNVASVAGMMPGSGGHTLYPATKAALIRFSEGLHVELAPAGVHVTALCPGFTYSEFHDVNGTRAAMGAIPRFLWLAADAVVEAGVAGVLRNDPVVVPGAAYKAITSVGRLVPARLVFAAMRRNARRLKRG